MTVIHVQFHVPVFHAYRKNPAWVDSKWMRSTFIRLYSRRLKVSWLVHWLKINKLFNAVSFDVLIVVSVIICHYATVCCLHFTNQDVGSDQHLQEGSRTQWLIWYVTYHHIWQFLQLIGHLNAVRPKLFLHCRQDLQQALHTSAIVTCQYR